GSGERVISLMAHPYLENIHAIDLNNEALYLLELKLAALSALVVPEYLVFTGYTDCNNCRASLYREFRNQLTEECKYYWDNHIDSIERGVLHIGHFESFLSRIRPILKIVLGKEFFRLFEDNEFKMSWLTDIRWKCIHKIFSQSRSYSLFGLRDDAFLSPGSNLSIIPDALQHSIDEKNLSDSCLAHLIFFGKLDRMNNTYLPPSFDMKVLQVVKDAMNTNKIAVHFHCDDYMNVIRSFDSQRSGQTFHATSDILSFVDFQYLTQVLDYLRNKSDAHFTMILRAFVRNQLDDRAIEFLKRKNLKIVDVSSLDKTNMYQLFQIKNH
ncbi:MAG: BtaA family protein, partial [Bacteroidia bacterium]|nr:BtaA family protein [Bacteroidia bacterium]